MVISKTPEHSASNPKSGTLVYSGGGGAYLRFSNGQVSYVVYTAFGKGWEADSVAIEKGGKPAGNVNCTRRGTTTSEMGPDFFEKAALPNDDEDFDLPDEAPHE